MNTRTFIAGFTTLASTLLVAATASAVGPCCFFCQKGRCQVEVDVEEVDVKGFDVECEAICIPPLRFPWECGPLKKCGKVRCVKKLVSDKKTKKVCTYDWEAIACCPDCRSKIKSSCGGCCDSAGCDTGCCETGSCDTGCASPSCDTIDCCANATVDLKIPAAQPIDGSEQLAEVHVPQVPIALVHAIEKAKPDANGWVEVSNLSTASLSANDRMLE